MPYVKIKPWKQLEKEFGLDRTGNIKSPYSFTRKMEKRLPRDRVILVDERRLRMNYGDELKIWRTRDLCIGSAYIIDKEIVEQVFEEWPYCEQSVSVGGGYFVRTNTRDKETPKSICYWLDGCPTHIEGDELLCVDCIFNAWKMGDEFTYEEAMEIFKDPVKAAKEKQ